MERKVRATGAKTAEAAVPTATQKGATAAETQTVPEAFRELTFEPRHAVLLLSGPRGVGKSSLAKDLCMRFPQAVHIDVERLRKMQAPYTAAKRRHDYLARRVAAFMAVEYSLEGFFVVMEDRVVETELTDITDMLEYRHELRKVVLTAEVETLVHRNTVRNDLDVSSAILQEAVRVEHALMLEQNSAEHGWWALDTSLIPQKELADQLLAKFPF